jgi:hypothetical protein
MPSMQPKGKKKHSLWSRLTFSWLNGFIQEAQKNPVEIQVLLSHVGLFK